MILLEIVAPIFPLPMQYDAPPRRRSVRQTIVAFRYFGGSTRKSTVLRQAGQHSGGNLRMRPAARIRSGVKGGKVVTVLVSLRH
ncbi:hypothetical protein KCP78_03955 [Salmonella enterica subsp. enterica]|nr:hypothetical protein KCP78_03955 [Salmonella enterica subsp. enterica]